MVKTQNAPDFCLVLKGGWGGGAGARAPDWGTLLGPSPLRTSLLLLACALQRPRPPRHGRGGAREAFEAYGMCVCVCGGMRILHRTCALHGDVRSTATTSRVPIFGLTHYRTTVFGFLNLR